ncbi:MAG: META domain-containing protein [Pararhodobacter sp.]
MRLWLIALGVAFAVPALAQAPRIAADGTWRVVEVDGQPLAASDSVSMTFTNGQATGGAGCNRFFGGYSLMPGFALDGIGTTRMACQGRAAQVEAAFLAALAQVNDWRLEGETGLDLLLDDRALVRAVLEP